MQPDRTNSSRNLFDAVLNNDEKSVKHFVEGENVPVTITNSVGMTAAHMAASNGNLNILKYLIEKDSSLIEMKDRWQQTALLMAAGKGALDVVEYLVDTCNANIFQNSHVYHINSVVHIVAEAGQLEVLKYLVEKKNMDVNKRNSVGQPPAFLAASQDHVHIVEYFLNKTKADVTMIDNEQRNILHMSVVRGYLQVPKFLLDQRKILLDIDCRDSLGRSILNSACRFAHINLVKYLVSEKNANVNLADNMGWTPLHQVAFLGNSDLVRYLVEHKADPVLKDIYGKTPSDLATNVNVTEYLTEAAMTVMQNRTRRSVFHASIPSNSFEKQTYNLVPALESAVNDSPRWLAKLMGSNSYIGYSTSFNAVPFLSLANTVVRLSSDSTRSQFVTPPEGSLRCKIDSIVKDVLDSIFSEKFRD